LAIAGAAHHTQTIETGVGSTVIILLAAIQVAVLAIVIVVASSAGVVEASL